MPNVPLPVRKTVKFELEPYNRNVSDEDLLSDLKRVASELKLDSLSREEYEKNGKYHPSTLGKRFGSWTKALKLAGVQIRKHPKINADELLDDLKRVANILKKQSVTQEAYNSLGKYSPQPFIRTFGSWFKALDKAGLEKTRTWGVSDEEYFKNLEEVWIKLGRQPKNAEIEKPLSKYSGGAYEQRFGSWRKALEAFITYVNEEEDVQTKNEEKVELPSVKPEFGVQLVKHRTGRNISWRLRFIVMKRDNFKCKICGRSPATDLGITLEPDHIIPWANGGETILENLQTLCSQCNIGKSNLV